MGRDDTVGQTHQRVVLRQGLWLRHIQPRRPDDVVLEGCVQIIVVDDTSPSRVDNDSRVLHPGQRKVP